MSMLVRIEITLRGFMMVLALGLEMKNGIYLGLCIET